MKLVALTSKLFLLLFFMAGVKNSQAQWNISFSGGFSFPTGKYASHTQGDILSREIGANEMKLYGFDQNIKGLYQFNTDWEFYFGKAGIGISMGQFAHEISEFNYHKSFPYDFETNQMKVNYYGAGSQYKWEYKSFSIAMQMRAGIMHYQASPVLEVFYQGEDLITGPVPLRNSWIEKQNLPYLSTGFKTGKSLRERFRIFIKAEYFTALKDLEFQETYYNPVDIDQNGQIDIRDVRYFTIEEFQQNKIRKLKPMMFHFGLGISYEIPLKKKWGKKKANTSGNSEEEEEDRQNIQPRYWCPAIEDMFESYTFILPQSKNYTDTFSYLIDKKRKFGSYKFEKRIVEKNWKGELPQIILKNKKFDVPGFIKAKHRPLNGFIEINMPDKIGPDSYIVYEVYPVLDGKICGDCTPLRIELYYSNEQTENAIRQREINIRASRQRTSSQGMKNGGIRARAVRTRAARIRSIRERPVRQISERHGAQQKIVGYDDGTGWKKGQPSNWKEIKAFRQRIKEKK